MISNRKRSQGFIGCFQSNERPPSLFTRWGQIFTTIVIKPYWGVFPKPYKIRRDVKKNALYMSTPSPSRNKTRLFSDKSFWKCNLPMNHNVCLCVCLSAYLSVCRPVCQSVSPKKNRSIVYLWIKTLSLQLTFLQIIQIIIMIITTYSIL